MTGAWNRCDLAVNEGRTDGRQSAILKARLRGGGAEREACVLDLSARGLMASADVPPRRGTIVELVIGCNALVGHVQWSEERRFGVRLRDKIDVQAVLNNLPASNAKTASRGTGARPSAAATFAFSRHVARGFTYGILIAVAAVAATTAARAVGAALQPLSQVGSALGR